jgi:hypothetical protein
MAVLTAPTQKQENPQIGRGTSSYHCVDDYLECSGCWRCPCRHVPLRGQSKVEWKRNDGVRYCTMDRSSDAATCMLTSMKLAQQCGFLWLHTACSLVCTSLYCTVRSRKLAAPLFSEIRGEFRLVASKGSCKG